MNTIRRIYVEKKGHANASAESLLQDIRNNLQISSLEEIRILNCYDITGVSAATFEKSQYSVFMEPPLDNIYEGLELREGEQAFAVQYLPGQYDQRADSAVLAINAISLSDAEKPKVKSSKTYILKGSLTEDDIQKIKNYIINPVDSHEIPLEVPKAFEEEIQEPKKINVVEGFLDFDEEGLHKLRKDMGLAMTFNDILHCQNYYKSEEKRNPTITEIRVLDTYWSDHCRHTTFMTKIEDISFEDGEMTEPLKEAYEEYLKERNILFHGRKDKYICLMDIAQMGMRVLKSKGYLKDLDESEEINACSIKATIGVDGKDEEWLIMFKNETHNHPTEIEPFGGAATCLGGAIRDPLSGRAYVYQAMRVTGSGNPNMPVFDTIPGKLSQRKITTGAAHGYSSYGNQIGLATGGVYEIYDEGYVAKRMEIGAVIGAVKAKNVVREVPAPSDCIILLGGRTGRDGCGGATGSSKEHTEESILTSGAEVQKGNAPTERKIQRLFRKPEVTKLIKRCNDFGAGGVSVAIGELAEGLFIDLDKVPKKYEGLDGTELAISESQERMAVVVDKDNADAFIKLSEEENLEAVQVAVVTAEKRLVMQWQGKDIVNISRSFLDTNGAEQKTNVIVSSPRAVTFKKIEGTGLKEQWLNNLKDLNVCAKKGLVERFDASIGASTVLMPFGGKYQLTPAVAMAAKIPVETGETDMATIMSYGFDPAVSKQSPFHGAMLAVVESVSKIVASGGNPETVRLTFQEYFEKLRDEPKRWGKPFAALLGAFKAQMEMKIPSIGGKDSMSGSFNDLDVPPALVSFAVSVEKADKIISPEFKKAESKIVVLFMDLDHKSMIDFEALNRLNKLVYTLISEKKILSARNIGFGGIGAALSEMAFGNKLGFHIQISEEKRLFEPNYGGFILETDLTEEEINNLFKDFKFELLGTTTKEEKFSINQAEICLEEALKCWMSTLEGVFATKYYDSFSEIELEVPNYIEKNKLKSSIKLAKPSVFIPVFPGTNCEYDTKRAFEKAGAKTEIFVVKSNSPEALRESISHIAKVINNSQIIAMPGGFSAGDEPEGSGKFIAAVFKNPEIKEAIHRLLNERDGLIIGICNGFQALLKLGLLPYGTVRNQDEKSPTLTFNKIDRHISCIANTKVVSNKSPWLWQTQPEEIYQVAVSHGEGRFVCGKEELEMLIKNNQIATQYVDFNGQPTYDIKYNPNGSSLGIEAITSADGRILGKMGHSERIGKNVYKNVPGNYDMQLFKSGVSYFS